MINNLTECRFDSHEELTAALVALLAEISECAETRLAQLLWFAVRCQHGITDVTGAVHNAARRLEGRVCDRLGAQRISCTLQRGSPRIPSIIDSLERACAEVGLCREARLIEILWLASTWLRTKVDDERSADVRAASQRLWERVWIYLWRCGSCPAEQRPMVLPPLIQDVPANLLSE